MLTTVDIIGICAGILVIVCLIPQLVTIIKNKSSKDVSLIMYILLLIAQLLWATYGLLKNDLQLTITNFLSAFITSLIVMFSLYYR
jgi:MtN3 and saliva related transmembrane protein